jgi:hypothetical protein
MFGRLNVCGSQDKGQHTAVYMAEMVKRLEVKCNGVDRILYPVSQAHQAKVTTWVQAAMTIRAVCGVDASQACA